MIIKKLITSVLTLLLVSSMYCMTTFAEGTNPGLELKGTYSSDTTLDMIVSIVHPDNDIATGSLFLKFDTTKLRTSKSAVSYLGDATSAQKHYDGEKGIVGADWYYNIERDESDNVWLLASAEPDEALKIVFTLLDGVSKYDLDENSITVCNDTEFINNENGLGDAGGILLSAGTQEFKNSDNTVSISFDFVQQNPDTIISIDDSSVTTVVGTAPQLPEMVSVNTAGGETKTAAVVWAAVDSAKYAQAGTFDVEGTVDGTQIKAICHITVNRDPNEIVSVDESSVSTVAGVAPQLPNNVNVKTFGGETKTASVVWASFDSSEYAQAGTFDVDGTVDGTQIKAICHVTVNRNPNEIVYVSDVSVTTTVNIAPELPTTVGVKYYSGESGIATVTGWDAVSASDLANVGTFDVYGDVSGTDIRAKCVVDVKAAPKKYIITASADANGTISPEGSVEVIEGNIATFEFTPKSGYKVSKIVVDGETINYSSKVYKFENVSDNHTISVVFAKNYTNPTYAPGTVIIPGDEPTKPTSAPKYNVVVTADGSGSVKADKTSAEKGTKVKITVTPKTENDKFKGWQVVKGNINTADIKAINVDKGEYEIVMPDTDVELKAIFDTTEPKPTTPPTEPQKPEKRINTVRISGSDRYGTADHIAAAGWTNADTVIIASGEAYPDALAGAVLAKKYNAPILLTRKGDISSATLNQITKLGAKKAIILGGSSAVSGSVENSLKGKGLTVARIYGADRNATAAQIAYNVSNNSNTVILVSNANFADALSVSSAAALNGTPILYLNKDGSIPADTKTAIQKLGAKNAYVIGGTAAIGSKAEDNLKALGVTTKRIYGSDRYATSIAVYDNFKTVFTSKDVAIATGANFPDALAGAAFAANKGTPIFLVGNNASTALKERVKAAGAESIYVFGGNAVISDSTVTEITA